MGKSNAENLSAVLHGAKDLRLENRKIPEPNENEVLIKMAQVGVCGSDVHFYAHGKLGSFKWEQPLVIGHEASGTVIKCGKNVKNLEPGDRVAIEPGISCKECSYCKSGKYNLCPNMQFCAAPPVNGNLQKFYVHPADFCFKIPDTMDFEEATLIEPLNCAVYACKRGNVTAGSVVLILGSGTIGLSSLLAAKAFGASKVLITDILCYKLEKANKLGADCILKVTDELDEESYACKIKKELREQPDVSIECSGQSVCVKAALKATKAGGTVVLVGYDEYQMNLDISPILYKQVDVRGVYRYCNCYPIALDMIKSGKVNIKSVVTHRFHIESSVEAFEVARTKKGNPIKIMIKVHDDDDISSTSSSSCDCSCEDNPQDDDTDSNCSQAK